MLLFNFPGATVLSGFLPVAFFPTEILRQDHLAHPQVGRPTTSPSGRHFRQAQLVSNPEWLHILAASKTLYTCIHAT